MKKQTTVNQLSLNLDVKVTPASRRAYKRQYDTPRTVTVYVRPEIKQLLQKEAAAQGVNLSALLNPILVGYLQDCGTEIKA